MAGHTGTKLEWPVLTLTIVVAMLTLVLLAAVFGVYFTYSNSVVPGLDRVDQEAAAAAMRSMNVAIINPTFLATFLGPVGTGAATGFLLLGLDENTSAYLFLAGAGVYLVGGPILTGAVNVPMNNALDNGAITWAEFSPRWRRWNSVRTLMSLVALVLCGLGLYTWGG